MTLHVRDLQVRTPTQVLVDVSDVHLEPGRPVTIVGESGSGKSLLAHAVMGTLPAELTVRGGMSFDGASHDLASQSERRALWGTRLALLPQEPALALDPTMRVGAQVAEGARHRTDRTRARQAAGTLLTGLGLGGELRAYPHTLSGGMAQRVAFAAATIGGAQVLIADEPSKGLDPQALVELTRLLRKHVDGGGSLLTITHDLALARALGGDVLVMREAAVVERGPADQVLTSPAHPYTSRLLAAEPVHWSRPWARSTPAGGGEALVTGTGLAMAFGDTPLFTGLDVTVRTGDRLALHGPSGSGKTTLGNVLLRLLRPDRGQVQHAAALAGGRLQKLYQDPGTSFPARARLRDALGDVLRRHGRDDVRLHELLAELRLPAELLDRRPGQVSGGELQRLAIIRAMLLDPALLFADEPTSRLDLVTQQETLQALMHQVARSGCALVLVTHDADLAAAVADTSLSLPAEQPAAA